MNKQEFLDKFFELNPKSLWEINGPTRDGEKEPIFIMRGYSLNGHVLIWQQFNGSNGATLYFPEMKNTWDHSWNCVEQMSKGIEPYPQSK